MSAKHACINLYIITVIYNRRIDDIVSLPEFEKLQRRHSEVNLIVADNSTDETIRQYNREAASVKESIRYIECGGNIGLSRAYNRALATIPSTQLFWVMLADDDTHFSMEYLENGYRQIRQEEKITLDTAKSYYLREPLQLLCGIVETDSGWISPRTEHSKEMVFSSFLVKPKPGIYQDLYPINSGLFLSGKAIKKVGGFDERLFLDQVDFLMMDRLRKCGIRRIGVLPGQIRQSFSGGLDTGHDNNSSPSKMRSVYVRWEIFRRDFETYCELTDKPWYYRYYILGRRKLMLAVQKCFFADKCFG